LFGGSVTATVDSKGNIKAYYFIKQFRLNLLQILCSPLAVPLGIGQTDAVENINTEDTEENLAESLPDVSNVWNKYCAPAYKKLKNANTKGAAARAKRIFNKIIHFIKKTNIQVAVGLLLCPQMLPNQPNILSCVFTSSASLKPFSDLKEIDNIKIPGDHFPEIPSIDADFFGVDVVNDVAERISGVLKSATNEAGGVVNQAKNLLKDITFDVTAHVPVSIIPNPNFKV
jgi:hypothetical protein